MRTPPKDLDPAEVWACLAGGWSLEVSSARYVPEGGGSHHWHVVDRAGHPWFVTVDDLDGKDWFGSTRADVFDGLSRAFRTAQALRGDAGLDFVLAPTPATDGAVLRRISSTYCVAVYPFVEGRSYPFTLSAGPELGVPLLDMVVALHRATPCARDMAPLHRLAIGWRRDLETALYDPGSRRDDGPYAEAAQALVASHRQDLSRLLEGFDDLVALTAPSRVRAVITHGEPHPANVISSPRGLILIDWDTVGLGPPERDLWMIAASQKDLLDRYREATGHDVDPMIMTAYRLRWFLDDVASAVRLFRRSHEEDADTRRSWAGMRQLMDELPAWRSVVG